MVESIRLTRRRKYRSGSDRGHGRGGRPQHNRPYVLFCVYFDRGLQRVRLALSNGTVKS